MNKSIQSNANGIVDQAKQTVANVASDAKAGVQTQLEQKLDQAKDIGLEKIETVSDALRGAGEKLEGTGPLPDLANKAAEGIENLAHYFENKDIGDLFRGVETFARRQPALFLGGAVAVGILAGRFLKSSARSRQSSQYAYSGGEIDQFQTFGYEGEYGQEGDYLSADDLEEDWDQSSEQMDEPMAFQSESSGIGVSSSTPSTSSSSYSSSTPSTSSTSSTSSFDSRTTQPQGSSFGGAGIGASSRGNTEKMPVTQGTKTEDEKKPADDFSSFNKSSR